MPCGSKKTRRDSTGINTVPLLVCSLTSQSVGKEMQSEKHDRTWKVSVNAKSSGLRFKLKVAKRLPGPSFHRISLLLRVRKFVLSLTAGAGSKSKHSVPSPIQWQNRSHKSRFRRALEKLRLRRVKKTEPVSAEQSTNTQIPDVKFLVNPLKRLATADPICIGFCSIVAIIAIIALLGRFPRETTWESIIQFFGCAFLYYSRD